MTRAMKITLFGIALFFLAVAGSFIWFVATWDPEVEESVTSLPAPASHMAYAWTVHGLCMDCASQNRSQT
tara:strand:- start:450 stop:659 length:210 start_codon:yes stop_codon:yes gene_type:complete